MTHRWITWLAAGALAACVGRPDVASSPSGEAEQLLGAGQRALAAEELNRARGRFRDAQQVARALDDTDVQLRGLMGELEVALIRGEIETAAELAPTLDALARRQAVPAITRAQSAYMLARVDAAQGHSRLAIQRVETLTRRSDALGEVARLLSCREQLRLGPSDCAESLHASDATVGARIQRLRATAAVRAGDLPIATQWLESALALYRQQGVRAGVAATLDELGAVFQAAGNQPGACDAWIRALGASLAIRSAASARRITASLSTHCAENQRTRATLLQLRGALPDTGAVRWHQAAAQLQRFEAERYQSP